MPRFGSARSWRQPANAAIDVFPAELDELAAKFFERYRPIAQA